MKIKGLNFCLFGNKKRVGIDIKFEAGNTYCYCVR
jgi:hypothetical protein